MEIFYLISPNRWNWILEWFVEKRNWNEETGPIWGPVYLEYGILTAKSDKTSESCMYFWFLQYKSIDLITPGSFHGIFRAWFIFSFKLRWILFLKMHIFLQLQWREQVELPQVHDDYAMDILKKKEKKKGRQPHLGIELVPRPKDMEFTVC